MENNKKPPTWSESDRVALEELAKERQHRKWLADLIKRWAQWAAAIALGVKVSWEALSELVKKLAE